MKKHNRLILIDGSGYIFRAYYALPSMNRSDGTPVNAVYGFTNMLVKLIEDYGDEKLIVVFDAARENFRNRIYPDYKANRGETPEDLIPQFDLIKKCVKAFNVPQLELEGYFIEEKPISNPFDILIENLSPFNNKKLKSIQVRTFIDNINKLSYNENIDGSHCCIK